MILFQEKEENFSSEFRSSEECTDVRTVRQNFL